MVSISTVIINDSMKFHILPMYKGNRLTGGSPYSGGGCEIPFMY